MGTFSITEVEHDLILEPEECEGAAKTAVEAMPPEVKLVFSGNHVGDQVWTGGCLTSSAGADSPCRRAYEDIISTHYRGNAH